MLKGKSAATEDGAVLPEAEEALSAKRWRRFWIGLAVLSVFFGPWIFAWATFALNDSLASYVLLVPVISASLVWQDRRRSSGAAKGSMRSVWIALGSGLVFVGLAFFASHRVTEITRYDYLTPATLGLVLCGLAWGFLVIGSGVIRRHAFAIGFLIFAAPLPSWAVNGLEVFFQHTSAEVAAWMINLAGIPSLRTGLVFQLPGITIQVAQECSGIRSSIVLFVVSILAGHLVLRSSSRRLALALLVIPLGILRNGFRILTISALCVHVGPHMIDSPLHHRGGPLFFALSLIPFLGMLVLFRRWEKKATREQTKNVSN